MDCRRSGRRAHTRTFVSQIKPFTASRRANVKKNDNGRKTRHQTTKKLLRVSFATDGKQFPNCYVSVKNWLLRAPFVTL